MTADNGQYVSLGERWFCPKCERFLKKPPYLTAKGDRFHSWRCDVPMRPVVVTYALMDGGRDDA